MSSERDDFMSIKPASRLMSTMLRTARSESCNSLHPAPAAPFRSEKDSPTRLAGSLRNIYLVVTDIEAARRRLLERGVEVGDIRHKTPIGAWDGGFAPGPDPERNDYASFATFSDPDGNSWVLQERGYHNV